MEGSQAPARLNVILMRLAVLFSGGKDSCLALQKAALHHDVVCLLTIESENPASYMFHTPTIQWTRLQARAQALPLLTQSTRGEKERELDQLKELLVSAIDHHAIEGVVTGALASVYQATRFQRVCAELDLWCFNPLWQLPQDNLLYELLDCGFEVIITGVAAEPLDESWLGRLMDDDCVEELLALEQSCGLNPAGEGGEIETFVQWAPLFEQRIDITGSRNHYVRDSGVLEIEEACLE